MCRISWFADSFRLFIQVERSHLLLSPQFQPTPLRWSAEFDGLYRWHRPSTTFIAWHHGDIKLDNIVLSANDDAVFIDFEQVRHATECLAPEARGTWDVVLNNSAAGNFVGTTTISYVPYTSPEREETWSAYEAWAMHPEALEAIEVYSLGDAWKTL